MQVLEHLTEVAHVEHSPAIRTVVEVVNFAVRQTVDRLTNDLAAPDHRASRFSGLRPQGRSLRSLGEAACPFAALADCNDDIAKAWDAADNANDHEATYSLTYAMNGIVDAASYLTAKSDKGVAFQIMAASSQADCIRTSIKEWRRVAAEHRLERLLHRVMQRVGGDDDIPNVVVRLMPWRHKPEGKGS